MSRLTQLLTVLVGLLAALDVSHAKVYDRCELANKLRTLGVAEKQLADWVCLAYHESRYDTTAVGRLNWDNSVDHGLFQISDIYWCDWNSDEPGRPYKDVCGKNCNSFRDDDIADDLACVMKIHREHQRLQGNGFLAWVAWKQHCQHSDLSSYVSGCDAATTTTTQRPTTTTTTTTTTRRPTTTSRRPSVQDYYQKPSRTNAHTHFNNLAPLANLLLRGGQPQKGRLEPYVRDQSGGGEGRKSLRPTQSVSVVYASSRTQSSFSSSNPFSQNVFLKPTGDPGGAAGDRPHPFSGNVFLSDDLAPEKLPFPENMFLNGAGFDWPSSHQAATTRRPTLVPATSRRPLTKEFIPLWSATTGRPSDAASHPITIRRPKITRPKTTRRPSTTRRPKTTRRSTTTRQPFSTRRPKTTRKPFATRRPSTTRRPKITRRPKTTRRPYTTRRPNTTRKPKNTRQPFTTRRPNLTTRKPKTTRRPFTTRRPNITRKPKTTRRSFNSRKPKTTRRPFTTRRPNTTRRPKTTRKPKTNRRPFTTRKPKATRRPFTTHQSTDSKWIHLWPVTTKRPSYRRGAVHAWSTPSTTYRPSIFDKNGSLRVTPKPWLGHW